MMYKEFHENFPTRLFAAEPQSRMWYWDQLTGMAQHARWFSSNCYALNSAQFFVWQDCFEESSLAELARDLGLFSGGVWQDSAPLPPTSWFAAIPFDTEPEHTVRSLAISLRAEALVKARKSTAQYAETNDPGYVDGQLYVDGMFALYLTSLLVLWDKLAKFHQAAGTKHVTNWRTFLA